MIIWNVSSKDKWKNKRIHLEGKNLEARVNEETKRGLVDCFSTYDKKDTWQSLCAMMKLFKKVSHEVTAKLSIRYPEKSIAQIETYIQQLHKN